MQIFLKKKGHANIDKKIYFKKKQINLWKKRKEKKMNNGVPGK